MSSNRKYAGLPDLDIAPDIYETPDLTDDASTQPTSTALRSESRTSSHQDLDDERSARIDRHRLDPDEARSHFLPARVDATNVDFSDRVDGRRKSYYTSSRIRRKGINAEEELGDFSDEDETTTESLQRKIVRLQREAEKLRLEVERRHESVEAGADTIPEDDLDEDSLDRLSYALKTLDILGTEGSTNAQTRLAQKLSTAIRAPSSSTNGTAQQTQDHKETSSYTITYAPTYTQTHTLAQIAAFESRLTSLETLLGLNTLPLPTQSRPSSKAILPTLDTLDRQISFLASTSASSLDSLSKKVVQLIHDAERLDETRKAAKAAQEALKSSQSEPFSATANPETGTDQLSDPEQVSKINALYGTLPTIESLAPILPAVLDRLRSLRLIHTDAASAGQSLADVERKQVEMGEEIRSWREGLEKVEEVMREGEKRMGGNMGVVESWVKELEGRMRKLNA